MRPKNLISMQKYDILRSAQDDKMALGGDLNSELFDAAIRRARVRQAAGARGRAPEKASPAALPP